MTNPTASIEFESNIELYKDPAAIIDFDGKLLTWNAQFAEVVNEKLYKDMPFPIQEIKMRPAIQHVKEGQIGMSRVYLSNNGVDDDWLVLANPHTENSVLICLTKGELLQAFNDDLTSLPNRRDANNRMSLEWQRMLRDTEKCFVVAMVDIDHFKMVNDRFGHDIGDEVLVFVAQNLSSILRAGDWVSRWGGEEFLLYLHDTDINAMEAVAERIRKSVAKKPFTTSTGAVLNITISVGVVCSDTYVTSHSSSDVCISNMINSADVLLYEAKQQGRNCINSQQPGEKVFWDKKELIDLITQNDIQASSVEIMRDKKPVGLMWSMLVRGTSPQAGSRIRRSALKTNYAVQLDAAWLQTIIQTVEKTKQSLFVPISMHSLQEIETNSEFEDAVATTLANGFELIFIVESSDVVKEIDPAIFELLSHRGIKLCVHISDPQTIPTGTLNIMSPSYALLAPPVVTNDQQWHDLHATLNKHNVATIVSAEVKDLLGDKKNILYFNESESKD